MINSAQNYPLSQLFDIDGRWFYRIPKYQRQYTWGKNEWEVLYDDLLENDLGYFLGSIICINQSKDAIGNQELELVDGQQRLLTLSLLFAAICNYLSQTSHAVDEEQQLEAGNIKRKLVMKGIKDQARLIPQIQNNNHDDFMAVLSDAGVISKRKPPQFAANRRIFQAYRYFHNRIFETVSEESSYNSIQLEEILNKLNSASMVKIEVSSHAHAYTLFQSLNNRGIPLNAIDLIKNKLLATFDKTNPQEVDQYYERWVGLLELIGEDYSTQERFFRHYYNAFRSDLSEISNVQVATRSNLISIYERILDADAIAHMNRIFSAGGVYSYFLSRGPDMRFAEHGNLLKDLERVQGTPSHLLLLHLVTKQYELEVSKEQLGFIIDILVRFFVRRNLTDTPSTRDLTRMFMSIIEGFRSNDTRPVYVQILSKLSEISASDEIFQQNLKGPIYQENRGVTRFVLCTLAQQAMTRENEVDLWSRDKNNNFVWTIEHILPQSDPLPQVWVEMMTGGDAEEAKQIQSNHLHKLGNLTISGYNRELSNKSFEDKRNRLDDEGRPVGYNNGIILNCDLVNETRWSVEQIEERTDTLATKVMDLYSLDKLPGRP